MILSYYVPRQAWLIRIYYTLLKMFRKMSQLQTGKTLQVYFKLAILIGRWTQFILTLYAKQSSDSFFKCVENFYQSCGHCLRKKLKKFGCYCHADFIMFISHQLLFLRWLPRVLLRLNSARYHCLPNVSINHAFKNDASNPKQKRNPFST